MHIDVLDNRSFLNFPEQGVAHEQNLDTWEFGKGALSANGRKNIFTG